MPEINQSLVSVIIPVYNTGQFLPETIDSVEKQTHTSVEIILVDNGSDDPKTLEYLQRISSRYSVHFQDAKSVSEARNVAIEKATGAFILPLDSDDKIAPNFISKCLDEFKVPTVKVVRTQVKLFGKKRGIIKWDEFTFEKLLARNMMVVSSMFRKSDWHQCGGFDTDFVKSFEDWEFWINMLKDGGEVATVDEPLFEYRIRKKSRNHQLNQAALAEGRHQIWKKHKSLYAKHFVDPKETFEYKFATDSMAFKIGTLVTKPFNALKIMK